MVDSGYLRIFPEELLTPAKKEKNSGGVDNSGGWYYEYLGDSHEPIIRVNLLGKDKNGEYFSNY